MNNSIEYSTQETPIPTSKTSSWKVLGAVLLMVGTSIGGGMLALPVTTAKAGFLPSSLLLLVTWALMTLGAFLMLEVNLRLPVGSNLISMVRLTLGKKAEIIAWVSYLLLLYSLLSAYVAGGEDLVKGLLHFMGISISGSSALLIFVGLLSGIVCCGIRSVDWMNRVMMATKIAAFVFIVMVCLPLVKPSRLFMSNYTPLLGSLTTMITSFGFAIIIPSLRSYFQNDIKKLRIALLIGCLIPLICYLIWEAIIFGAIPQVGEHGLLALMQSSQPITDLTTDLANFSHQSSVVRAAQMFTSVCIVTAFLGVSLCLTDFLADGFRANKNGFSGIFIYALTFLPPTALILFFPRLFIFGISFAGIFCIILLMLLPISMALSVMKRHQKLMTVPWMNPTLGYFCMVIAVVLLFWGLLNPVR